MRVDLRPFVRRYGVIVFVILTPILSFAAYWLPLPSDGKPILFPVIVVFIPTLMAVALAAIEGGRSALGELFATIKLGKGGWLVIGALTGVVLQVAITGAALALGLISSVQLNTSPLILALAPATLLFALGEEIGWRGYAIRKLLAGGHSPLFASVLTGVPWALVHLSLFLPGMMFVGRPWLAQIAPIAMFALLHTWVFARSGGSVLAPTLLHGLFNTLGALVNSGLGAQQATYLGAAVLVASGLIVVLASPKWWFAQVDI